MKGFISLPVAILSAVVIAAGFGTALFAPKAIQTFGGPTLTYQKSLIPVDTTENIGTSTRAWDEGWFNELCLSADCRTSWPAGGSGGSGTVSTSTVPTVGHLAYWTSAAFPSLLGSVATTTASCSGSASCSSFTVIGASPVTITATGGSGVGTIATSTALTVGGVVYATSNGYPALVSTVATTTLTASSPLSLSQPINVFGSSASTLTIDTSGSWTGNAGTASALAANGSNCSAGSAAGGVTAAGAAEDCTDYWTEAENTAANYEQALTAGDGLTRTADDFDCDTASGSVFGCLSTTDWTTFNGKLSSYDAWTHPIAGVSATTSILRLAGLNASSTVLFDNATSTLLTATTAWLTNVFIGAVTLEEYISDTAGVMWTGNTETDITITYQDADNTIDAVVDTLPNLTGTLDVDSGGTGVATLTSSQLIYGNGTNALTSVATGTISAGTGISLSATAYAILNAVAISIDQAASFAWTGNHDFGGATGLELPNGTAPTVNATGETAWDTTSGQHIIYDGTATRVLGTGYDYPAFTYSTSTAWTGTTTIPLGPAFVGETWSSVMCFTDTGTVNVSFYDGTNRMNLFNASTTVGTVTLSTNNTFTAAEKRYVDVGTPATTPTKISCTIKKSITAD